MTLCDTGAIIALIDADDPAHTRCTKALPRLPSPLMTTWACLVEVLFYAQGIDRAHKSDGWQMQAAVWELLKQQVLQLHNLTHADLPRMAELMQKYRTLPMDAADATLVVAAERLRVRRVFTIDHDFHIYRIHDKDPFDVVPGDTEG